MLKILKLSYGWGYLFSMQTCQDIVSAKLYLFFTSVISTSVHKSKINTKLHKNSLNILLFRPLWYNIVNKQEDHNDQNIKTSFSQCLMPSFRVLCFSVLEQRILKCVNHIQTLWPSCSMDLCYLNNFKFLNSINASSEILLKWTQMITETYKGSTMKGFLLCKQVMF